MSLTNGLLLQLRISTSGCDSSRFFWISGFFVTNFMISSVKIKPFYFIAAYLQEYFSQFHACSGFLRDANHTPGTYNFIHYLLAICGFHIHYTHSNMKIKSVFAQNHQEPNQKYCLHLLMVVCFCVWFFLHETLESFFL